MLKYVIFEDNTFSLFSTNLLHCDMPKIKKPISAGFYLNGRCLGESTTLGLSAREEDANIIKRGLEG